MSRQSASVVSLLHLVALGMAAFAAAAAYAQQPLDAVPVVRLAAPEPAAILSAERQDAAADLPLRFAMPYEVNIDPETSGIWDDLGGGLRMWRVRITAPEAISLNFGFTDYRLPPGGDLWIYAADGRDETRSFTSADNDDSGEFWTPLVFSDDVVIQLILPTRVKDEARLVLKWVNYGYRGFGVIAERSGACEIDVICPDGDGWRSEIPAIGVYTVSGTWTCSGSMVNNTAQNQVPYFLTANHCGVNSGNASSVVVYWNFYSPTCGQHGGGSLSQSTSGATWRASYGTSDFTLIQMNSSPNPAWNITYAGWDRRDSSAPSAVGIHHPNCDEKSISFTNIATSVATYLGGSTPGDGTHLKVTWQTSPNRGVTEPGSSGSPIFDPNHHIVGQLHGGYSDCGASDMRDWYGRFYRSWTGGGTNSSRLSNWLDPNGTGALSVDTLSGCTAPAITTQPQSQTKCVGQAVTFTVVASGTAPLSYQWRKGGVNIGGATASSYTLAAVASGDAANYDCVVTNACGNATSNAATLTVNTAPAITTHPQSQTKCVGQAVTFTVAASGTAPLSYQWRKGGVNISGATASSYTIAAVVSGDAANYDCVVTNTCGSATSNAATLTVNTAPAITTHPQSQTKCVGDSVTFTVVASGSAPLSYHWRKGGVNITGATASSYTILALGLNDEGSYDCVVTNTCGSATSNAATLTVSTWPAVTTHPQSQARCVGQSVTFTVAANGTAPLSYQWRKGGVNLGGATASSYTIAAVATGDAADYDCVVTNMCGSETSNAATLTVNSGPAILTPPASQVRHVGQAVTFSVVVDGTPPLTYQWRHDGVDLGGATADTLTLSALVLTDAGQYDCVVSSVCGSVSSAAATLAVWPIGDANCDGWVNFDDILPFVAAITSEAGYESAYPDCYWLNSDCNLDSDCNFDDINPFVGLLSE